MFHATAGAAPSKDERNLVAMEDTVPPKVQYQNRSFTDIWGGVLYGLVYIAYLICGFIIVSKSHDRFEFDQNGDKQIAAYFLTDAQECCADISSTSGICAFFTNERRLTAGPSTFSGDEGIFDVFLEAPEIIIGLVSLAFAIAIAWVVALRFFAKPIVILVELCKIAICITIGASGGGYIWFIIAGALTAYSIWARDKLMFAAKMIIHSTVAMKENPAIFFGAICIKLLFAGNAALFVYFFAESFNVAEVTKGSSYYGTEEFCRFESPSYVSSIDIFLSLAYLWTILLFDKMRLSIIATVVGSWHFHPDNKPSVFVGIKNVCTSFGTLSIAALISAIAEYINKLLSQPAWKSWLSPAIIITAPLSLLMCCFGTCLTMVVKMFTKFSVILHVFTGQPFVGSAKSVFKILSRHFKGGFVTEVTSKSVLNLGSYAFSVGIAMISWKWIDDEFKCGTLAKGTDPYMLVAYMLMIFCHIYYPVLGLYVIIVINKYIQTWSREAVESGSSPMNYLWIPPLAATFVGCISMMMFKFLSNIFLDIIDTLFLCFAIDMDNNVDLSDSEFESLVKEMPGYIEAEVVDDNVVLKKDGEEIA